MASHHHGSPHGPPIAHQRPPPGPLPNGQPPYPAPSQHARQPSTGESLRQMNEAAWIRIGKAAEAVRCNDIAVFAYERALTHNQHSHEALMSVAQVLRADDKYGAAAEYIEVLVRLDGHDGEAWSCLGHCYLMMDELTKAYQAYQAALYNVRNPKEPKLWYGIGILYDRYGSLDHAEEAFSQVMNMAPDFDKANEIFFRLGIIYKQQTKYTQSLQCFQYIANNPPSPLNQTDILFQIGHVYEQQKDVESAKDAYRRVLERDPGHAKVLQQLGWLHHQENDSQASQDRAIDYLEKSVNSDQTDAQSWYLLGRCYMQLTKYPKAYEAYQQAVYRDGRNPTFWCSIGVLYYQINQYRDALDAYSRAIRLNPNISEVWYDLGTLYESCNNQTSDALDAYARASQLDPSNQHIKNRLQLLENGGSSGMAQSAGPHSGPPTYEPAAVNGPGPPGPRWGADLTAPNYRAPSQPSSISREWAPSHQPPPAGGHEPRDVGHPHQPAQRPGSPRMTEIRNQESHRYTPTQRQVSPTPVMRSGPNAYAQPAPPGPQAPLPAQQHPQQIQPPPPNRITNPTYGGQSLPPNSNMGPGPRRGPMPHYGRVQSPLPDVRPIVEGPPRSPRSGYPPPSHMHPSYQPHHADINGPSGITSGAPPPTQALIAAEAAARERDQKTPNSSTSSAPKRLREWEDRDNGNYKRNANEESIARLEDPYPRRRGQTPPSGPISAVERERNDRESGRIPIGGPHLSAGSSAVSSPATSRRPEEPQYRQSDYRPSEHAHHPQLLNIVTQPVAAYPSTPKHNATSATYTNENGEPTPVKSEEQPKREEERPKDQDGDVEMHQEEAPARKMEVDEDYDDDSTDDTARKGEQAPTSQPELVVASDTPVPQGTNGHTNGTNKAEA